MRSATSRKVAFSISGNVDGACSGTHGRSALVKLVVGTLHFVVASSAYSSTIQLDRAECMVYSTLGFRMWMLRSRTELFRPLFSCHWRRFGIA
jgi:hypothetical protein